MSNLYSSIFLAILMFASPKGLANGLERYPYYNAAYTGEILSSYRVYYDFMPMTLQIGVDPTFTEDQKDILDQAYRIFLERALHPNTLDCTYMYSTKDFPLSEDFFKEQILETLGPKGISGVMLPTFLFVANANSEKKYVGIAYLDLYYERSNPLPGFQQRKHFYIGINSRYLGQESDYFWKNSPEYWAGVIAHEMLHNLGYRHPTGYPGSFIKEYGRCISNVSTDHQWRDYVVVPD